MKKLILLFFFVAALFQISSAQVFNSRRNNPPPPPSNPQDTQNVPIDGGLSILLLAGAGYGIKRVRELKRNAMKIGD